MFRLAKRRYQVAAERVDNRRDWIGGGSRAGRQSALIGSMGVKPVTMPVMVDRTIIPENRFAILRLQGQTVASSEGAPVA
jgi:hypothetical protein